MDSLFEPDIKKTAGISECGRYRFWLRREWDRKLPAVAWVMLNPSTADAEADDPTIRKCVGFSKLWGFGAITVVNLFALRSADPSALKGCVDPNPSGADQFILSATEDRLVIAAWGNDGRYLDRDKQVMDMLFGRREVMCLGITDAGCPRHPLYVSYKTEFEKYSRRER